MGSILKQILIIKKEKKNEKIYKFYTGPKSNQDAISIIYHHHFHQSHDRVWL